MALAWGLFEWRVRNVNKSFIRLSALGTSAVGLMGLVFLTGAARVVSFCLAMPALGAMARPFAQQQIGMADTSVASLEQALAKKDWKTAREQAEQALAAMTRLSTGPAISSLVRNNDVAAMDELHTNLRTAATYLRNVQQAINPGDSDRTEKALKLFHVHFGAIATVAREQAK